MASTKVADHMGQGWVMFVSVFCFVISTLLFLLYLCGAHGGKSSWVALVSHFKETDTAYVNSYLFPYCQILQQCIISFFTPEFNSHDADKLVSYTKGRCILKVLKQMASNDVSVVIFVSLSHFLIRMFQKS